MKERQRPRIGLLGITQELYDDVVDGITDYQHEFGAKLTSEYGDWMELVFPGPARNREQREEYLSLFNQERMDGVMVVMMTYAPSNVGIRAFQENTLPVILANLQPERTVSGSWDMASLTYNQGIHGIQDLANCLSKLGMSPPIISGDWQSEEFARSLKDWAYAAMTAQRLRRAKIATFGQMPGMGDITGDPHDVMRVIGTQVDHAVSGEIYARMEAVDPNEVEAEMERDASNFEIDPKLSAEKHRYAATMYVAIRNYLEELGYDGFCVHFDALGRDGRFEQIHMLAASNLMAAGYGYAAEGDVLCATLMVAGHVIADDAHFTEMYAMDFDRNAVLMSHMGEGNWRVAESDRKPRLIDRELRIGGLGNPPTVLFSADPGPATLASLANLSGGRFRLVVTEGNVLEHIELPNVEMPYFFIQPAKGRVEQLATSWLEAAGTHHQVMHRGHIKERWRLLAKVLGIDYVEV